MQKNADQVEKDILRSEELLAVVRIRWKGHTNRCIWGFFPLDVSLTIICFHQDSENEKKDLPLKHQTEISDKLGEAEGLLKDLFLDVDKAKKLKHPQATEIESEWVDRDRTQWPENKKYKTVLVLS